MKLLMVYVYPNGKQFETLVGHGTIEACERELELLTEKHEKNNYWMVNEIIQKDRITREFASEKDGHVFNLVICEESKVLTHYVEY